jgi:hypothetical protein
LTAYALEEIRDRLSPMKIPDASRTLEGR